MEIDRVALKRLARRDMQKKRPSVLLVSFVYLLLTAGVSFAVSQVAVGPFAELLSTAAEEEMTGQEVMLLLREHGIDLVPTLAVGIGLTLLVSIFTCVLQFGYTAYALGLAKGETMGFGSLFTGFGMLGRVLGLSIVTGFFSLMWVLAIFTPAVGLIVLAAWLFVTVLQLEWLAYVVMYLLMAAAYVLLFARVLRYAMALRVMVEDPEVGVMGAIERSKELMKGRRWELVKLELSFLGWYLAEYMVLMAVLYVGIIVLILMAEMAYYVNGAEVESGLDMLMQGLRANSWILSAVLLLGSMLFNMWLMPYALLTESHFYLAISGQKAAEPEPAGRWVWHQDSPSPVFPTPPVFPAPPPEPFTLPDEELPPPAGRPEDGSPAPEGTEDGFPAPEGAEEKRSEDPWDRPADSRRNPEDPF